MAKVNIPRPNLVRGLKARRHKAVQTVVGRPLFAPTRVMRQTVETAVGGGIPYREICLLIINPATNKPIDVNTLQITFEDELVAGKLRLQVRAQRSLATKACGIPFKVDKNTGEIKSWHTQPDTGALIWLDKTRFGYRDVSRQEHTDQEGNTLLGVQTIVILPSNGRELIPPTIDVTPKVVAKPSNGDAR